MKFLPRLALAASLTLFAAACGEPERNDTSDAGTDKTDAGTCTPTCSGAACGADNGCGGKCAGTCSGTQTCNATTFTCEAAGGDGLNTCGHQADFGSIGALSDSFAENLEEEFGYAYLSSVLVDDERPDLLDVELYVGDTGPFKDGIKTGTFTISGAEANYETCSVCVLIRTDLDENAGEDEDPYGAYYMATSGSVTLTSVQGRLTGSLSNVEFTRVDINPNTYASTPHASGCKSKIGSVSFDAEYSEE